MSDFLIPAEHLL